MAGSILNAYLEDPPLPGEHPSVEHVRASLTLSSSIASVTHSFTASANYDKAPEVTFGPAEFDDDDAEIDVWMSSRSSSDMTVKAKSFGAVSASNTGSILIDLEVRPDLS